MTTAPTEQLETIAHLDFDVTVPCASHTHQTGTRGCVPTEPARWLVLLPHLDGGPCGGQAHPLCDGFLGFLRATLEDMVRRARAAAGPGQEWGLLCTRCGRLAKTVDELLIVVTEL